MVIATPTDTCVICNRPVARYLGHVHRGDVVVKAGWCCEHSSVAAEADGRRTLEVLKPGCCLGVCCGEANHP